MSALEKLVKAFEALKVFQDDKVGENSEKMSDVVGKVERMSYCHTIKESICTPSLRNIAEFPKFLSISIDTFLFLCDDSESDVRMVADECLNHTIKLLLETNLGRLQVELYKELKKNGASRTLRAALSRFADMAHLIRPQKCRPYIVNLVPCLMKIAQREEEAVQETLVQAMTRFCPVLMPFANESEIKLLLKAFLPNLHAESAVMRRTAASSLALICQHSNKSSVYLTWTLDVLLDMILPVDRISEVSTLVGVLTSLRHLLPLFNTTSNKETDKISTESLKQLFQLLLHQMCHADHNVVTSSLETMQTFLKNCNPQFYEILVTPRLMQESLITSCHHRPRLPSVDVAHSEELSHDDSELVTDVAGEDVVIAGDDGKVKLQTSDASPSDETDRNTIVEEGEGLAVSVPPLSTSSSCDTLSDLKVCHHSKKSSISSMQFAMNDDSVTAAELVVRAGDIGSLYSPNLTPIEYCVRHLCSQFLLAGYPGQLIPDSQVRVSVKALALACFTSAVALSPQTFLLYLHQSSPIPGELQEIRDVLLLFQHSDPHIKGHAALLVGHLLQAVCTLTLGNFTDWTLDTSVELDFEDLLAHVSLVLEDRESFVVVRHTLVAAQSFLPSILNSSLGLPALKLIPSILQVASHSYWLLKVELSQFLAKLDFRTINYLEGKLLENDEEMLPSIQDRVENVIVLLLSDEDSRVRVSAAEAIVLMVPKLFYPLDNVLQDVIASSARLSNRQFLEPILHEWSQPLQPLVNGLSKPYHVEDPYSFCSVTETNLARIVSLLMTSLQSTSQRHSKIGFVVALSRLSEVFMVTQYASSWGCLVSTSDIGKVTISNSSVLEPLLDLLISSSLGLDLAAHSAALTLAANLLAGISYKCLNSETSLSPNEPWIALSNRRLVPIVTRLFKHILLVLNICTHIIEDMAPSMTQLKSVMLPTAPSLSQIKGKAKDLKQEVTTGTKGQEAIKAAKAKAESTKENIGNFSGLPNYLKLYAQMKSAYSHSKLSFEMSGRDKFGLLLSSILESFGKVLELASMNDIGKATEEILSYLKATVLVNATQSIQCVQQVLKALFGMNIAAQSDLQLFSLWESVGRAGKVNRMSHSRHPGLYHSCISAPYVSLTQSLASSMLRSASPNNDHMQATSLLGWLKKLAEFKSPSILKVQNKTDKVTIGAYIRLFEPLVIKALKQYTVTSELGLQAAVLRLLSQLVQLRVNYCLLDSDQIFIGFVIKQFEYIEEGQIRNSHMLISDIFQFLVLLTYDRFHSKLVVTMPKIIQLCDGILASGLDPTTHAIPALQCLVSDLFVLRGSSMDSRELDTQQEVLISMIIRLVKHYQALELIIIILHQCRRQSEDRWKRLSRQIIDVLLPILSNKEICIPSAPALDVVHRLFECVAPSVFRPVDDLLTALFVPIQLIALQDCESWMALILVVLRVLISQSKEDIILSRMDQLFQQLQTFPEFPCFDSSEEKFAWFLLKTVDVVSHHIQSSLKALSPGSSSAGFLAQELAHLILYITHLIQPGLFRRITQAFAQVLKHDRLVDACRLNACILDIGTREPVLSLLWSHVLVLLDFSNQSWWEQATFTLLNRNSLTCNQLIMKLGNLILFCDHACDHLAHNDLMTWLIVNHIQELISISQEPPVQDFIGAIHRSSAASHLFVQAVSSRCDEKLLPALSRRCLQCLEAIHMEQTGPLLVLLSERFLDTYCLSVSRLCDRLVCRRIESLLADTSEKSKNLLPPDDMIVIKNFMQERKLTLRHSRLWCLLQRLELAQSGSSPDEKVSPEHPLQAGEVDEPELDLLWYTQFVSSGFDGQLLLHQLSNDLIAQLLLPLPCAVSLEILQRSSLSVLLSSIQLVKKHQLDRKLPHYVEDQQDSNPSLMQACESLLFSHLSLFLNQFPKPHKVLLLNETKIQSGDSYPAKMMAALNSDSCSNTVVQLARIVSAYIGKNLAFWNPNERQGNLHKMMQFSVIALEYCQIQQLEIPLPSNILVCVLGLVILLLDNSKVLSFLNANNSIVCSMVLSTFSLLQSYCKESLLDSFPTHDSLIHDSTADVLIKEACDKISALLDHLKSDLFVQCCSPLPSDLLVAFRCLIVKLGRINLMNSYARVPPMAWQMGWQPVPSGEEFWKLPPLPLELLTENDLLEQLLLRVNLLGWTSRSQFEETWVAMQSVLNTQQTEDVDALHQQLQNSVLAVRCISCLLVQTMLSPLPGNPTISTYRKQPRSKEIAFFTTRWGKKLSRVLAFLHMKRDNLSVEPEVLLVNNPDDLLFTISLAQLNLASLCHLIGQASPEETDRIAGPLELSWQSNDMINGEMTVDLQSFLQVLIDLYGCILDGSSPSTPALIVEVLKSVLLMSDLMTEVSQWQWMLAQVLEFHKRSQPEDDFSLQFVVLSACKSAAVLQLEASPQLDRVFKLVELGLASVYLSVKFVTLQGILYLLQSNQEAIHRQLVPVVIEFLNKNLIPVPWNVVVSHSYQLLLWATAFYLMENYSEYLKGLEFQPRIFSLALSSLSDKSCPLLLFHGIADCLQRHLLVDRLTAAEVTQLQKWSCDTVKSVGMNQWWSSLSMLLCCMYSHRKTDSEQDSSLKNLEVLSLLFERIRKGNGEQADFLCQILPQLLRNFFPAQDIMNKVIGEFLSSQQPHPQKMAQVVFQVFEDLLQEKQQSLLHDWILLSLSNFTQRTPLAMAVWSISVFLLSASQVASLRLLFPLLLSRMGKLEVIDHRLFCLIARNFLASLGDTNKKLAFLSVFMSVAQPDNVYSELLSLCPAKS